VAQANVKLTVDATNATRALQGVQNKTNTLQKSFGGLRSAIAGVGITVLARNAVKTAADFNKLNIRLKLLTKQTGTFAKSQEIAAEAQRTFGLSAEEALEGITNITARLAPLGIAVEDIKSTFFGFNTAAKLAGASTIEASNAFRQLAQALGSGRLQGDEFRSLAEQIPTLLQPIAAELGVSIGELKKFASEGKLTSDVVLRALRKIEKDGGASLKALVAADPTQVFKNLTNATEDLSRAIGQKLNPVVLPAIRGLTNLTLAVVDFLNSPIGTTAAIFVGIAGAVKAFTAALTLLTAAKTILIAKFVATKAGAIAFAKASATASIATKALAVSTGALAISLNALPLVALATALGVATTAIIKHRQEQKKFNDVVNEGSEEEVNKLLNKQKEIRDKIIDRLNKANGRSQQGIQNRLAEVNADIALLEGRDKVLEKEKEITKEKAKQNEANRKAEEQIKKNEEATKKLKEKFMEIGKAVEDGIVQNLTDAAMGTQTLGQAAINVLNQLKRKLIEVAMQQAVSGIGNFLGNALGSLFTGGFGGGFRTMGGKSLTTASGTNIGKVGFMPSNPAFRGAKANGGPVMAGGSYLVGERGPELFTPRSSGTITANEKLGGSTVNNMITVNVDASGSTVEGNEGQANSFGQALGAAIQAELIAQKRAGGLLSNA
jgi:tape measure domain-containing protein